MRIHPRKRLLAQAFAALAASLWGFTYSLSATYLPPLPLFDGGVRALLAGIALLLLTRSRAAAGHSPHFSAHQVLTGSLIAGFFAFHFTSLFTLPGGWPLPFRHWALAGRLRCCGALPAYVLAPGWRPALCWGRPAWH